MRRPFAGLTLTHRYPTLTIGTHSERVAIGEAIEAELGNRQGQRTDKEPVENFPQVAPGEKTRDLAAKAAGFGNGKIWPFGMIGQDT